MKETRILANYPIQYLQDKLYGICTGDFVIIACASGTGKSTLSRLITFGARDAGQPVVLYSLENQSGSFVLESTLREFSFATGEYIDGRKFAICQTQNPEEYEKYRRIVYQKSKQTTQDGLTVLVVHEQVANADWNITRLIESMKNEIEQGYKLFIIDHLDVLAPNDEYRESGVIMRELWALVDQFNIAIVSFSQVRKTCTALCPSQYDLRGNMNKVYKCTHLITLGKHDYGYYLPPIKYPYSHPTYVRIAKARNGSTGCAVCYFNNIDYLETYKEVLCDEPGNYIDGMTRDKLTKYKDKQKKPQ